MPMACALRALCTVVLSRFLSTNSSVWFGRFFFKYVFSHDSSPKNAIVGFMQMTREREFILFSECAFRDYCRIYLKNA